jgi:hypothetical protein
LAKKNRRLKRTIQRGAPKLRLEITIPDQLYGQAKQAAQISGLSVESFVLEAVQLHLDEEDDSVIQRMFTPERLALIAEAKSEMDAGLKLTPEQAREDFAKKKADWIKAHKK